MMNLNTHRRYRTDGYSPKVAHSVATCSAMRSIWAKRAPCKLGEYKHWNVSGESSENTCWLVDITRQTKEKTRINNISVSSLSVNKLFKLHLVLETVHYNTSLRAKLLVLESKFNKQKSIIMRRKCEKFDSHLTLVWQKCNVNFLQCFYFTCGRRFTDLVEQLLGTHCVPPFD